jgi:uncharacterized protein (DUF924 family)
MSKNLAALQKELIDLWFGPIRKAGYSAQSMQEIYQLWFNSTDEMDLEFGTRFKAHILVADKEPEYEQMAKTSEGFLALCVLTDQLTRNVFSQSKEAFSKDAFIRRVTKTAVESNLHKAIFPAERTFAFLPLMHSEDLNDHKLAKILYTDLFDEIVADSHPEHLVGMAKMTLAFLKKHTDIIEKFGRYPHRNKVLGRENTAQEVAYINSDEFESFGQ